MKWFFAAMLAASLAACRAQPAPADRGVTRAGAPLPGVALRQLDGQATLPEALAGRAAVIDVFATWCGPCREGVPAMNALAHSGLTVVGVDVGDPRGDVRRFVRETGLSYPVFLDEDFSFADRVGASRVPTILVVDRRGHVIHRSHGLDAATRAAVASLPATSAPPSNEASR
jgi:thiol-disulfide isomerase/thioredoxin